MEKFDDKINIPTIVRAETVAKCIAKENVFGGKREKKGKYKEYYMKRIYVEFTMA